MKYSVILGLVLAIVGVTSFLKSEQGFKQQRDPADIGVDGRISTALEQIKNIQDFKSANSILEKISKELMEIKTEESRVLSHFFIALKNSEGLLFSLESVIEKFPLASVGSVNSLKSIRSSLPMKNSHLKVLIDRLFINNAGKQYSSVEEFQKDIIVNGKYLNDLLKVHDSLVKATLKYPAGAQPIDLFKIDLSVYAGLWGKFIPESKRVIAVNSALLHIAKAELEKILAHTYYLSAYNLEKFGELRSSSIKATSKKVFGLTYRVGLADSNELSRMSYHERIEKDYYKKLFKLHKWAIDKKTLKESKKWVLRSLNSTSDAIVSSKQVIMDKKDKVISFDQKLFETYSLKSQKAVEFELKLLSESRIHGLVDPLTGKTIKVNPSEVFNSKKMSNLSRFFPDAHDKRKRISSYGAKTVNLNYGNPISWQEYSFGGVLPENSKESFKETLRIINTHSATTWVSSWLGLFL